MKKLTYTNSANGFPMEFSSDSRTMHLDLRYFDGFASGEGVMPTRWTTSTQATLYKVYRVKGIAAI